MYTSQEAAKVRGTPLEQGAKAMLFKADDRPVLLVVAAHHRIDRREFKRLYNVKDLRLLESQELHEEGHYMPTMAAPPFMASTWPVMKSASSDARKAAK